MEKQKLENEFKKFVQRNFEQPSRCKNLDQIRFYIRELCNKIREYEEKLGFAPTAAYSLLAQYNSVQNSLLHKAFVTSYGSGAFSAQY